MPEQYYTASEAQQKLGFSKAVFFRKVKQGIIRKIVLPGMKQGVYPRRDIDALTLSMQTVFEQFQNISFGPSTIADQMEEIELGIRAFGRDFITPLPERIAFQQKSEFTFHSLKAHGHVVGYFSIFHLPPLFLEQLLVGTKIERDITLNEVVPFTRLKSFSIYIDVLVVDSLLPQHQQSLYAGLLISHMLHLFVFLRKNGYLIEKVYTITTSKETDALTKRVGFCRLSHKSLSPGRVAWELTLNEASISQLPTLWKGDI
jgi:hypothetical protein